MTVVDTRIFNGRVILPGQQVTANLAGHDVRVLISWVHGEWVGGVELLKLRRTKGQSAAGRIQELVALNPTLVISDGYGRTFERGNTRAFTIRDITTIHRAREAKT